MYQLTVYAICFCKLSISITFILSIIGKMRNFSNFQETIALLKIFPKRLSNLIASSVLAAELTIIILILFPNSGISTYGYILTIVTVTIFTVVLFNEMQKKEELACNCFGKTHEKISPLNLLRNSMLIVLSAIGLILPNVSETISFMTFVSMLPISLCFAFLIANFSKIVRGLQQVLTFSEK